jgi:branched-chain amino acid transport system substrate-binding protein
MSERNAAKRLTRREFMKAGTALAGAAAATPWLLGQGPARAATAGGPMVGAIPEALLKGTLPAPKFTGEIRIGSLFPRSGVNAYLGEESWRGAELAVKVINAKGGINGKEVKVTIVDTPDPSAGVSEAERLISKEGMKIITGTTTSFVSYAVSELTERNRVIMWEEGAVATSLTARGFKYMFRTCIRSSDSALRAVQLAKDGLAPLLKIPVNQLKVAMVHEDSQYGADMGKYAEQYAKEAGIPLLTREAYSTKTVDLSSLVLKLKGLNPDVLLACQFTPDAILFWKQARELDFMPKAMIGTGAAHSVRDFYKAFGSAADGIFSCDYPQFDQNPEAAPGITEFMQLYRKTYNEEMRAPHSLVSFTGFSVLWDVLARAGSTDPDAVRKAAHETDIPLGKTPVGWGVKFAPPGDPDQGTNTRAYAAGMQWQEGGKFVTVWPRETAAGEIKYIPMTPWSQRR